MPIEFDDSKVRKVRCWTDDGCRTKICSSLVGASMVMNTPRITVRSISEWWFRINFCKAIGWTWPGMEINQGGGLIYPTHQDLVDHIGLFIKDSTVVARHTWIKKMSKRIENAALSTIERSVKIN